MQGLNVDQTAQLLDKSDTYPALVTFAGKLWLSWSGTGNKQLNLLAFNNGPDHPIVDMTTKVVLSDTSPSAPALAVFNNRLYIAWRGDDNNLLNIMSSADGRHFDSKQITGQISNSGPALAVFGGKLWMAWTGKDNNQLNVMSSVHGNDFDIKTRQVMGETSDLSPAICALGNKLWIGWQGRGNHNFNLMSSTSGNNFDYHTKLIYEGMAMSPSNLVVNGNYMYALLFKDTTIGGVTEGYGWYLLRCAEGTTYDNISCAECDMDANSQGRAALAAFNNKLYAATAFRTVDHNQIGPDGGPLALFFLDGL